MHAIYHLRFWLLIGALTVLVAVFAITRVVSTGDDTGFEANPDLPERPAEAVRMEQALDELQGQE